MRRFTGAAAAVILPALAAARLAAQEPVDRAVLDRIAVEARERPQVEELFRTLTDVIGARLAGSPSYQQAAAWARDRLTSWGLDNARLEPFEFGPGWSLEGFTAEMTSPWYLPLTAVPAAWSPSTAGELTASPVYVGDMSPEEIQANRDGVRGAILLFEPMQTQFARRDRWQPTDVDGPVPLGPPLLGPPTPDSPLRNGFAVMELPALEPAVVLTPSFGEHGTLFVGSTRAIELRSSTGGTIRTTPIPRVTLSGEHYNLLVRLTEAGEPVQLRVEIRSRLHEEDQNSYNVLAELPGTDPQLRDEVVMIGAHLDSWHGGVGATDNADAVASAMEAMRILTAAGAEPRRTIRLALWGGEELGLLGSRAYVAEQLADEPARDRISVYLNDDPGTGPTYGFYMEENPLAMALFDVWLRELEGTGVRRNVFEGIGGTDHNSFDAVGIPAFTAIKDYTSYDTRTHHTNADLAERVRPEDLTQSAIVLASMAWLASMSDERVPRRPEIEEGRGRWGVFVGNAETTEPIVGVRVTIEGTPHVGVTNERGDVVFENVTAGRYAVMFEHPDFQTLRRENLPISAGRLRFGQFWLDP
jgi:hypothetical protein